MASVESAQVSPGSSPETVAPVEPHVRTTAFLLSQLSTLKEFRTAAESFADWKTAENQRAGIAGPDRSDIAARALLILCDIHVAADGGRTVPPAFDAQWGSEGESLKYAYELLQPKMGAIRETSLSRARAMKPMERALLGLNAAAIIARHATPPDQKQLIIDTFQLTRSDKEKIAYSVGLAALLSGALMGATYAGGAYAVSHDVFAGQSQTIMMQELVGSYVLQYAVMAVCSFANVAALRDARIGTTPYLPATIAHYFLRTLTPDSPAFQQIGVAFGTLAPSVYSEAGNAPLLLVPHGSTVLLVKNVVNTLGVIMVAAMQEFYRHNKNVIDTQVSKNFRRTPVI